MGAGALEQAFLGGLERRCHEVARRLHLECQPRHVVTRGRDFVAVACDAQSRQLLTVVEDGLVTCDNRAYRGCGKFEGLMRCFQACLHEDAEGAHITLVHTNLVALSWGFDAFLKEMDVLLQGALGQHALRSIPGEPVQLLQLQHRRMPEHFYQ